MDVCYQFIQNPVLDGLMRGVSFWGDGVLIPVALVLMAAITLFIAKRPRAATILILATLIGNLIKDYLKNLIGRPRPAYSGCRSLVNLQGPSFPSGHVVFYTIFFGFLIYLSYQEGQKKSNTPLLILRYSSMFLLFAIGFSRIYLGAHWTTDVLAGYVLGGIILAVAIMIERYAGDNARKD